MAEKKRVVAKVTPLADAATAKQMVFAFGSGEVREVNFDQYGEAIQARFLAFGAQTKLSNSYAGHKLSDKSPVEMFDEVNEALLAGNWNVKKIGEPKETPVEKLADALVAAYRSQGKTPNPATVLAFVTSADKAKRAALKRIPEVASALAAQSQKADTPSLAELEAEIG